MAREYVTRDGDTVDYVAFLEYGNELGIVEQILAINPHLVNYGATLPYGVTILLPEQLAVQDSKRNVVMLW
jgi:phage tail protein X